MARLTENQCVLLTKLQLNATQSIPSLATGLGLPEHTVRYALAKAIDAGIVTKRCFLNPYTLGFAQYQLYFSLRGKSKEAFIKELADSELVSWIGKLGGDFNYGANFCATSITDVYKLLERLSHNHGGAFLDKVFATRMAFTYFGNRYLAPSIQSPSALSYTMNQSLQPIDELDHTLLKSLVKDPSISARQRARELAIPQSTVDYRLRSLEERGVISGYYYEVDPTTIGYSSYLVLISTRGISSRLYEALLDFAEREKNIVVLTQALGTWDFELGIDASSPQGALLVYERLTEEFANYINWSKLLPHFGNVKVKEYPRESL